MLRPRPLLPGGRVGVIGLSSPSTEENLALGLAGLRDLGFEPVAASNLTSVHRGFLAGTDAERVSEFNRLLRDPTIDGYMCARGGYGAMRILESIDFDAIRDNPRPIVGFSDATALHQAILNRAQVVSFHGPMVSWDLRMGLSIESRTWFRAMLAGDSPMVLPFDATQTVASGAARGPLFGGCLSLTMALIGTPWDLWIDDGIWFWEDTDEAAYRLDRMLTHLRLSGRLARIRGVMIGKLKACGDGGGRDIDELFADHFSSLGIPVVRDLPFGHSEGDNRILPIGAVAEIDTSAREIRFEEPVVAREMND